MINLADVQEKIKMKKKKLAMIHFVKLLSILIKRLTCYHGLVPLV